MDITAPIIVSIAFVALILVAFTAKAVSFRRRRQEIKKNREEVALDSGV